MKWNRIDAIFCLQPLRPPWMVDRSKARFRGTWLHSSKRSGQCGADRSGWPRENQLPRTFQARRCSRGCGCGSHSGVGPFQVLLRWKRGTRDRRDEIDQHYRKVDSRFACQRFVDFREMLDKQSGIDAILCATPDHLHAYVSIYSMRKGKHVYCEKPLTHNVAEARLVAKVAKETGRVTQMGNQGHATEGIRQTVEWIRDGAIGTSRRFMPGRELHDGIHNCKGRRPMPWRFHRAFNGICGWGQDNHAPITLHIAPSAGATSGTSEPVGSAISAATIWMPPSGPSTSAIRRGSKGDLAGR